MDAVNLTFTARPLLDHFEAGDPLCASKTSERRNVELIDRLYAAIGAGDAATMTELLAPDAILTIDGFLGMDGRWQGAGNILAAAARNFALVEGQQVAVEQVCAQGDQLVILFQETGRYRPTGEEYVARAVQWFHISQGKVAALRELASVTIGDSRTIHH